MAQQASLFRVLGPSGVYYAVYETEKHLLFTEANEKGARDHATELGLELLPERQIQHADLMRLTGRDAPAQLRQPANLPVAKVSDQGPIQPITATLPSQNDRGDGRIFSLKATPAQNPFASGAPVADEQSESPQVARDPLDLRTSEILTREVMNFAQAPRTGRKGNPFSDIHKKPES